MHGKRAGWLLIAKLFVNFRVTLFNDGISILIDYSMWLVTEKKQNIA